MESFSDFLNEVCCPRVGNAFSSSRAYGADSDCSGKGMGSSFSLFRRFKRRCCCLVWIKPSSLIWLLLFSRINESLLSNDGESSWEVILEAWFGDLVVWRGGFFVDGFRSLFDDNLLLNERLRSDRESCIEGIECGEVERGRGADTISFQDDVGLEDNQMI